MTISELDQAILLSQSGLSFYRGGARRGGAAPDFAVLNIGAGVVSWSVSGSTLSGGEDWLSVILPTVSRMRRAKLPLDKVSVSPARTGSRSLLRAGARGRARGGQYTRKCSLVFLEVLPRMRVGDRRTAGGIAIRRGGGRTIARLAGSAGLQFGAEARASDRRCWRMRVYSWRSCPKESRWIPNSRPGSSCSLLPRIGSGRVQRNSNATILRRSGEHRQGDRHHSKAEEEVDYSERSGSVPAAETGPCTPNNCPGAEHLWGSRSKCRPGGRSALQVEVMDDCGARSRRVRCG